VPVPVSVPVDFLDPIGPAEPGVSNPVPLSVPVPTESLLSTVALPSSQSCLHSYSLPVDLKFYRVDEEILKRNKERVSVRQKSESDAFDVVETIREAETNTGAKANLDEDTKIELELEEGKAGPNPASVIADRLGLLKKLKILRKLANDFTIEDEVKGRFAANDEDRRRLRSALSKIHENLCVEIDNLISERVSADARKEMKELAAHEPDLLSNTVQLDMLQRQQLEILFGSNNPLKISVSELLELGFLPEIIESFHFNLDL